MKYNILIFLTFLSVNLFASNFTVTQESSFEEGNIIFNMGEYSFEQDNSYHKILSEAKGKTQSYGEPELPTYTFNYAIQRNKEYEVAYEVVDFDVYYDINLFPTQLPISLQTQENFSKNSELYNSSNQYPDSQLNVIRSSIRGNDLLAIELIPFEYSFQTKILKVFNEVEIVINETNIRENYNEIPRSQVFEKIYNNIVINNDNHDTRNFQIPSILYILEDYTSVIDPLVEWRRKQGFEVIVVDSDETGSSTSSIKNYISNAYNNWSNPPEFVCLVGDANGSLTIPTYNVGEGGSWWGAYGEGDFPYTLLDGNDNLPDIIMGRMSVRSTSSLATVVNKIIGYEKNYAGTTNWLRAAALVGDPYDSGISTVITNEYIEEAIGIHGGITDVRTKYSGSGYDTWMRTQINDGVSYLNYRGFYGFSNFNSSDISQLNNGFKLPFLTTLTCDTGSFSTDNECITEALFRAGSSATPKGAIAVVGTAQPFTHTAFNNIVTMGMYEGIFIDRAMTAGEALIYGQLALAEIYPQDPNNNVYYFSTWNNLIGDPATQLWTSTAKTLFVDHNLIIIEGSNNFQVFVQDQFNQPFENASVTLYKSGGGIHLTSLTNENGIADFEIDSSLNGDVFVTTRCHNCLPVETEVEITDNLPELVLLQNSIEINEYIGNSDGFFNPNESIEISFEIDNLSIQQINNLTAELTSESEYITVNNSQIYIESISPAGTIQVLGLSVSSSPDMPNNADPQLRISLYNSESLHWNYLLPINFLAPEIQLSGHITNDTNNNGYLERDESGLFNLTISNIGTSDLNDVIAEIDYSGGSLSFGAEYFDFSNLSIGQSITIPIEIGASDIAIHGSIISIPINFFAGVDNLLFSTQVIQLQIGQLTVNDPMGPDSYGYYIYDMEDYEYQLSPNYEWIEIDPDYGGIGNEIGLYDSGDNNDDVVTVTLPFPFTFYGEEYYEISVCSNGWISFGQTDMRSFRNYTLPGPGGPSPMVAVFWDDLKTTNGGDVYHYYNEQTSSYIIEWSNLRTFFNNSIETFQIILYDNSWETPTGDNEMKIQFKEFNNTSVGDYPVGNYDGAVVHGQYCTVGIENQNANDGLQYTYNNVYSQAAMPLSDQSAILITTRSAFDFAVPSIDYDVDSIYLELQPEEDTSFNFSLSNNGEENSNLFYDMKISPYSLGLEQLDDFGYAWTDTETDPSVDYNWIDIENDYTTLEFDSNDGGTLVSFGFNFPFYNFSYGLCAVMANGWISFNATGSEEWNNGSVFDESSPRGAIFAFWDDLNPSNSGGENGSGSVKFHSNTERAVIWYDNVIHWTSPERIYDFQIVLHKNGEVDINYREMIGDVDSATVGIIDSEGEYGLEVLYNQDNIIQDEMSILFAPKPAWVEIASNNNSGNIFYEQSELFNLSVEAFESMEGLYNAYILINSNASNNPLLTIPVVLSVSSLVGDVTQDGIVDVLDLVRIVAIIMETYSPSDLELLLADINSDGTVDVLDVVSIVNTILNQ